MSKKIEDLNKSIQNAARDMIEEMKTDIELSRLGVTGIFISETKRDMAVQMAYYSRGRMKNSDVRAMYKAAGLYELSEDECNNAITWTLDSMHLRGLAIDLVPEINFKINWNAPKEVWHRMGELGKQFGFKWGGDWSVPDYPHFEALK